MINIFQYLYINNPNSQNLFYLWLYELKNKNGLLTKLLIKCSESIISNQDLFFQFQTLDYYA